MCSFFGIIMIEDFHSLFSWQPWILPLLGLTLQVYYSTNISKGLFCSLLSYIKYLAFFTGQGALRKYGTRSVKMELSSESFHLILVNCKASACSNRKFLGLQWIGNNDTVINWPGKRRRNVGEWHCRLKTVWIKCWTRRQGPPEEPP